MFLALFIKKTPVEEIIVWSARQDAFIDNAGACLEMEKFIRQASAHAQRIPMYRERMKEIVRWASRHDHPERRTLRDKLRSEAYAAKRDEMRALDKTGSDS